MSSKAPVVLPKVPDTELVVLTENVMNGNLCCQEKNIEMAPNIKAAEHISITQNRTKAELGDAPAGMDSKTTISITTITITETQ